MPSTEQLKVFYSTYSDIRAASDVVSLNAKRNLQLLSTFGYNKNKTVLDFGTGNADFVEIAGENCFGLDFKPSNKLRVYQSLSELPLVSYDFISMWGVLEHLSNPIATFSGLRDFISQNGIVALTTVDAESVIPYYYKPVEHLTYWTKKSIENLFAKIGMELIEYSPYRMLQHSKIYVDRLLSRTPIEYRSHFQVAAESLPKYIEVPTNEVFVVGRYVI